MHSNPTTRTQPVQVHQHPDQSWFVTFYGQAVAINLPHEQAARMHAGIRQAIYDADLATADRETYGRASALEVALEARIGDASWVSRPAALCCAGGWRLPYRGFAAILTGDTVELWHVERGQFAELACVYREQRQPPVIDRDAVQAFSLTALAAYAQFFARRQDWPIETAYAYLRFFLEPFALDIRDTNDTEVAWYYAGEVQALRPAHERHLLLQSALNWFALEYPHTYADLLDRIAPPASTVPTTSTTPHGAALHTGQSGAAQTHQEAA